MYSSHLIVSIPKFNIGIIVDNNIKMDNNKSKSYNGMYI